MAFFSNFTRTIRDFFNRDVRLPILNDTTQGIMLPPELKPILDLSEAEAKRQRDVLRARTFHDGDQGVQLTQRLKEFLGIEPEDAPCLNLSRLVTTAVAERLMLDKFSTAGKNAGEVARQEAWANALWADSRLDSKQGEVWEEVLRDGEGFLFVDWNPEGNDGQGEIELIPHPRYTDAQISYESRAGDGFGMRFFYPGHNTYNKPEFAVKRSTETGADGKPQDRLTIYYPHQIRKWYRAQSGWMPLYTTTKEHPEGVWPLPWVDVKGKPLGIPIVHFKTPFLRSEAREAQRLNRALNKLLLDFLTAGDVTAFRVWKFFGWEPWDKDGVPLATAPGQWIGSEASKIGEADFEAIDGPDMSPMAESIKSLMSWTAIVNDTPAERLQLSGQVASDKTLEQQDEPLIIKLDRRSMGFGLALTDALKIARRLENHFSTKLPKMRDDVTFASIWKPFRSASTEEKAALGAAMLAAGYTVDEIRQRVWGEAQAKEVKPVDDTKPIDNPKPA